MAAHVRRLEAFCRTGIVERLSEGFWRVPADLVDRGRAYDRQRVGDVRMEVLSHQSLKEQKRVIGATWLDFFASASTPRGGIRSLLPVIAG